MFAYWGRILKDFVQCLSDLSSVLLLGILVAVVMKSSIFWDITPCSPVIFKKRFGRKHRLQFAPCFTLFLVWNTFQLWRWREYVSPKHLLAFTRLYGVISLWYNSSTWVLNGYKKKIFPCLFRFVCYVTTLSVAMFRVTDLSVRMTDEWWIIRDLKRSDFGLIEIFRKFRGGPEKINEKLVRIFGVLLRILTEHL
jgi:hypothetical protein